MIGRSFIVNGNELLALAVLEARPDAIIVSSECLRGGTDVGVTGLRLGLAGNCIEYIQYGDTVRGDILCNNVTRGGIVCGGCIMVI